LAAPADDKIVVSEIGEQWSPKIPPLSTAAIVIAMDISKECASGIAIGIIIANVPYDVPVVNAMMDPKINNNAGIMIGEVVFFAKSTKKSAVPSSDVMVPIDQANVKMINTMVMLLNPLTYRDIASLKENNFCCIPMIRPTMPAINAAIKIDTPPSASPTAVTISCSGKPPVHRNIGGIKASKTMIGIIIFRFLS